MTQDKLARADEPQVVDLNRLARRLRVDAAGQTRFVPWFDPDSGGIEATVLVLMETPGPRTVAAGSLGFSSEDNPDPTAQALREARVDSGLRREDYLRWNIVPWPLYDELGHRRPPQVHDLEDAHGALDELLSLLPRLRLVITVGAPALSGVMRHLTLEHTQRLLPVLGVPHPSPRNARQRHEARVRLANALRRGHESLG